MVSVLGGTSRIKSCAALPVNPDGIPITLRMMMSWIAWQYEERGAGNPAKEPVCVRSGKLADITDPRQLVGFDDASAFALHNNLSGVGFVLSDPFAGLDLDHCRDPATGELDPIAADMLAELNSYAEVSPSGTGVKAIALARLLPDGPKRRGNVELYDRNRYFAITGQRLNSAPATIEPRQDTLCAIQARLLPTTVPCLIRARSSTDIAYGFNGADDELLARAFAAGNGGTIKRYWAGDMNGKSSPSEAMLGLAQLLAFWTGPDELRLDRLVQQSGLLKATEAEREKWESRRKDSTWGMEYVVRKAIQTCRAFYTPSPALPSTLPLSNSPAQENPQPCKNSVHFFYTPSAKRNPVATALARVDAGECPPGIELLPDKRTRTGKLTKSSRGIARLAGVCWVLAGGRDGGTFTLSISAAGKAFGVEHTTVSRWLKVLKDAKVITRIVWGNSLSERASRWLWNGIRARSSTD